MATRATAAKVAPALKPTAVPVTAKQIMQTPVIAATPQASLRDLASRLVTNEFSGMPVADLDGRVVGVITEADILRALLEGKRLENLTARQVMTRMRATAPAGQDVDVAWNPEFLREGFAVQDSLAPDRIVLGVTSDRAEARLRQVYRGPLSIFSLKLRLPRRPPLTACPGRP